MTTHAAPAGFDWETRARRLADQLVADGYLTDPAWAELFARVPRHVFVPYGALADGAPEEGRHTLVRGDRPEDRDAWLAAVYSEQTLITRFDTGPAEEALLDPSTPPRNYTSSGTGPRFLAPMLEALDARPGVRVLDVGTGTGYGVALLCERLGDGLITSVDLDPELVDQARDRLAGLGHRPTLVAGDGAAGHPPGAPYDRILATTSWPYVPPAWLGQAPPGAVVVGDILGQLGGALYRLTVDGDGGATGRFLPEGIGFMLARPYLTMRDITSVDTEEGTYDTTTTSVDPAVVLDDRAFGFLAQVATRDAHPYWWQQEDGRWLSGYLTPDGSWAEVYPPDERGERRVEQGGPRRLWTEIERAHVFWVAHDRPDWTGFGLTVTPADQYVWYESPDSGHVWSLRRAVRRGS